TSGHLNMGDLRDALSRSQLKLDDLAGPGELLFSHKLLRLNSELAVTLDGVYHRGETYLRWLQRFSALGFGTVVGRLVTRFLVLPFLGAFVALMGPDVLMDELFKVDLGLAPLHVEKHGESVAVHYRTLGLVNTIVLALFLVLVLNSSSFRRVLG